VSWQARIRVCWGTLTPPLPGSEPTPTDPAQGKGGQSEDGATNACILLVLAPYLPVVQKAEVVDIVVRGGVLDVSDGVAQKVGMRLVGRLVDLGGEGVMTSVGGVGELLERLAAVEAPGTTGGGKVRVPSPLYAGVYINYPNRRVAIFGCSWL